MNQAIVLFFAITIAATASTMPVSAAMRNASEESFLMTVAQGQQSVILLGQLAVRKAMGRDVKQFAAKMIEDHQRAVQEVQRLALKGGFQLPVQLSKSQKQKQQALADLRDRDFDREYMRHMLRDHSNEVTELEQIIQHLQDKDIKQWALNTLPVLKQHLQKAFHITSVMIIDAAEAHMTQYVPVNQQERMCIEEQSGLGIGQLQPYTRPSKYIHGINHARDGCGEPHQRTIWTAG